MGAQFTPGPWVVNPFVAQVDCETISEQGGLLPVCRMLWPTDERSEAETGANAHLIAAAPELYKALHAILGPLNVCSDNANVRDDVSLPIDMTMGELRKARAALRRARGEA